MLLAILLAALPQESLLPLDQELDAPFVPGTEWVRLEPEAVERHEDYEAFSDAFSAVVSQAWRNAPAASSYSLSDTLPAAWTLGELLGQIVDLRSRLHSSRAFDVHNGPLLRAHLTTELERLLALLSDPAGDSDLARLIDWPDVAGIVDERFQPASHTFADRDPPLITDSLFFAGRTTQVILRLDEKSPPPGGAVPLEYYATLEQAVEFRAVCARVTAIFSVVVQAELERTALRLGQIDAGWTNYLEHGFSQYPWESWANGWLTDFAWSRPPRSQWVLLHPELGLVFDTRSTRSAEMEAALLVHGLGYVRYFGDERDWFAGLSATASITDDASYGWGFGPTLHFGHTRLSSRVPHVSVSVLWHDFEDGGNEPVLAATLDLWRLVDRGNELLYSSRLAPRGAP
jgi:hypothetical protein